MRNQFAVERDNDSHSLRRPAREFYAEIGSADWRRLRDVFKSQHRSNVPAALQAMIADGLPVNAAVFTGDEPTSIADLAWHVESIEGMLFMLEKLPDLIHQYDNPLQHFSCFPPVVEKVLEDESSRPYLSDPNLFVSVRRRVPAVVIEMLALAGMNFDIEAPIDLDVPGPVRSRNAPASLLIGTERKSDVLETLARLGMDLTVRDYRGNTLIHCIIQAAVGDGEMGDAADQQVEDLHRKILIAMDCGVDIDMPNHAGDTALHQAVRLGFINKTKTLIECEASLQAETLDGKTVADIARASQNAAMCQVIEVGLAHAAVREAIRRASSRTAYGRIG